MNKEMWAVIIGIIVLVALFIALGFVIANGNCNNNSHHGHCGDCSYSCDECDSSCDDDSSDCKKSSTYEDCTTGTSTNFTDCSSSNSSNSSKCKKSSSSSKCKSSTY